MTTHHSEQYVKARSPQMAYACVLTEIKVATHQIHKNLHKLLDLEVICSSHEKYIDTLKLYYGILNPLEAKILDKPHLITPWFEADGVTKAQWIASDLYYFGLTSETLMTLTSCPNLPSINTTAQIFGALYVLEGSTLGAQVIYARLVRKLGLSSSQGARYFYNYGPNRTLKWVTFCRTLERFCDSHPHQIPSVISSAYQVFLAFEKWFAEQ